MIGRWGVCVSDQDIDLQDAQMHGAIGVELEMCVKSKVECSLEAVVIVSRIFDPEA